MPAIAAGLRGVSDFHVGRAPVTPCPYYVRIFLDEIVGRFLFISEKLIFAGRFFQENLPYDLPIAQKDNLDYNFERECACDGLCLAATDAFSGFTKETVYGYQ